MLSGSRAYKRAIRIYKIWYESFSRIPFDDFEMECTSECNGSLQSLDEIDKTYDFNELPKCNKPHEYCTSLITYEDNLGEKKCIIKLLAKLHWSDWGLLNLIYEIRSRKWNLYIETTRSALPWFCAYDKQNFSRYLTVHYYDFLLLKDSRTVTHRFTRSFKMAALLFSYQKVTPSLKWR